MQAGDRRHQFSTSHALHRAHSLPNATPSPAVIRRAKPPPDHFGPEGSDPESRVPDHLSIASSHAARRITLRAQLGYILFGSPYNILLPFVPAGFAVYYTNQGAVTVFAVNFIAIVPTALLLNVAAEELMVLTGDTVGALINSTFSNGVQLITSILLLHDGQIPVLKTTLIGTILSSMHLMLGLSFFLGGLKRIEQRYNITVAQVSGNLLLLTMVAVILPTMGHQLASISDDHGRDISRGISFILIIVYAIYLYFQLVSHSTMYGEPAPKSERRIPVRPGKGQTFKMMVHGGGMAAAPTTANMEPPDDRDEEEENKELRLARRTIMVQLLVCTTLVAFNTTFATNSLDGLMQQANLSPTFVGIVLLPLLSNDVGVIKHAVSDEMDLCILLTVGKCLQTILLVIPFSILLGWIMGQPMDLQFDPFEIVALFASVVYINSLISNGSSTYLDGVLLLSVFLIICLTSYWVPN